MRNIIAIILISLPTIIFAQETFENNILDRLCGLKIEGKPYLNLGEYAIFTDSVLRTFNPKSIKKLKRKYKLKKVKNESTFKGISEHNKVISKKEIYKGKFQEITTVYFIDKGNQIDIIGFYSIDYRDTLEEQSLVKLYLENKIPESIFMEYPVSKVDFIGREIELNNSCNWMNVNSIQCPYFGQMNWSLHQSLENAKKQTEIQYQITKGKEMAEVLSEDEVQIIFEGKETTAKRMKYKAKIPKFLMNGSNELIIYYVSEEVRGRFVSCVLSHYTSDKVTENGVPPLLEKVMKLKK
jgi:hypothetical protein